MGSLASERIARVDAVHEHRFDTALARCPVEPLDVGNGLIDQQAFAAFQRSSINGIDLSAGDHEFIACTHRQKYLVAGE